MSHVRSYAHGHGAGRAVHCGLQQCQAPYVPKYPSLKAMLLGENSCVYAKLDVTCQDKLEIYGGHSKGFMDLILSCTEPSNGCMHEP